MEQTYKCPKCGYEQTGAAWDALGQYDHKSRFISHPIGGDHCICPECGALLHLDYDLIESKE